MVLPSAPSSISLNQVNTELARTATATICMNDAQARTLAGKPTPSGQIAMCDFYGKSSGPPPPTGLSCSYCGGNFGGCFTLGPSTYYLIVGPLCLARQGGTPLPTPYCYRTQLPNAGVTPNAGLNQNDGYLASFTNAPNVTYPAFTFTRNLNVGGYSDWYLPGCGELRLVYPIKCTFGPATTSSGNSVTGILMSSTTSPATPTSGTWFFCGLDYTSGTGTLEFYFRRQSARAFRRSPK